MKRIAIYGAGGLGKEVACLIDAINRHSETWKLIGYFDDGYKKGELVGGISILGGKDALRDYNGYVVIAIGDPLVKKNIAASLDQLNIKYASLIHPNAILMNESAIEIGYGTIVTAGVVLTTDIKLGNHVLLNLSTTIGHDVSIGAYSSIMCGVNIAGSVNIAEGIFIGSGANVINGRAIASNARVGAGAVVIDDIEEGKTVVGIPARAI